MLLGWQCQSGSLGPAAFCSEDFVVFGACTYSYFQEISVFAFMHLRNLGYRAGRFGEAIARLEEAIAPGGGAVAPAEAIFLAMARFRAGEPAEAQARFASPWRDEPAGSAEDWWAWRGRRLLRREAERLILKLEFPANPFARSGLPAVPIESLSGQ
jgi:hypothetical protein